MAGLGTFLLEVGVDLPTLQQGLRNAESQLTSFGKKAEQIGSNLSLSISAPLALIARSALKASGEFESLQVAFGTMLRDMDKGNQLMQDIQKFNLATPFEFEEVAGASKSLLAFGFAQQQIIPNLKMIGDLSSALGINIKELADIYGKAKVQGRLFAEDINQLTGRGIPVIAELAKQFKTTEDKVKGLVESGKIGFGNLERAFVSMTSKGGQFYDMTAKQSQTLKGIFSNFSDSVTQSLTALGDSIVKNLDLKNTLGKVGEFIADLTKKFQALSPEAQKAILVIGGIAIIVPPLLVLAGTVLPAIATGLVAITGPAGLAGIALAGAATYAIAHWDELKKSIDDTGDSIERNILTLRYYLAEFRKIIDPAGGAKEMAEVLERTLKYKQKGDAPSNTGRRLGKYFVGNNGENPPPTPPSGLDPAAAKKAADAIKKIKDDLISATYQSEINSMLDSFAKQKATAQKSYEDDVKSKMESVKGKKGLEDEYANYVTQRYKELQVDLRKIEQEEFKTPSLINRKMVSGVQGSLADQQKGLGDKFANSLERTLTGGVKGIEEESLKQRIESLLGVAEGTISNVNFDQYKLAAQSVLDANQMIKDSLKSLAGEAITNMSIIVGQMIAGTATMADLGKSLAATISQALADIARVQIATGLVELFTTGNPLRLLGGIGAGIGSGIIGGMGNKKQSNSNYGQQMQYSVIRGGDIFTANNRYQTIKGF